MSDLKFLILLPYFNRPKIVKNALESFRDSTYQNFQVAFCDDGSSPPGRFVVEHLFRKSTYFPDKVLDIYDEIYNRFKFYRLEDSIEQKKQQQQSRYGKMLNQAIRESDADIVLICCDDDALQKDYLENLNNFYKNNPEVKYAHSKIILFNPLEEDFNEVKTRTEPSSYLSHDTYINPYNAVDASQVSWRRSCNIEGDCWFDEFRTTNHDAHLWAQFWHKYGGCAPTGFVGQFKGWHHNQLGRRHDRGVLFEETE